MPFIEDGGSPADLIGRLTTIRERSRDFYVQVFLVEIDNDIIAVHDFQQWGDFEDNSKTPRFIPSGLALAAPVVTSSGGNPRVAQGRYAVPAYPIYGLEQIDSEDKIRDFLSSRMTKTFDGEKLLRSLDKIVGAVAPRLKSQLAGKGLVVLCDMGDGAPYHRTSRPLSKNFVRVTESALGGDIYADLDEVLKRLWWAKLEEGAEWGHRLESTCSICGAVGETVSLYSKSWPLFRVTWSAPFSTELDVHELNEAIGLCQRCSAALSYGGKLFTDLSRPIPPQILQAAFQAGVDTKSKAGQSTVIRGVALPFPVLDNGLDDEDYRDDYRHAVTHMRDEPRDGNGTAKHVAQIVGFESILPEEVIDDAFRLSIYYYTEANADIQLIATVEDVSPAHIQALMEVMEGTMHQQFDLLHMRDASIPRLLARAYGAGYLWQSLAHVLRGRPLARQRFLQRMARALNDIGKLTGGPQGLSELQAEAKFYAVFNVFWQAYSQLIHNGGEGMRTWQVLQEMAEGPASDFVFSDVEDLGFIIGHLVRRFAAQFYSAQHKDFMRTRVMTFGSALTPDVVGYKALGRLQEFALKLD
ncbi:MAG: hypothetical protein C7B44_13810, partial [Sulfobacillus thermosulfidooxidans]